MDIAAYLNRINHHGPVTSTAETLRQLQVAHLRSVPFENLSIHSGEAIILKDEALFEKIVVRRRGGFCYELNGLFAALLRALGFNVSMLSASTMNSEGQFGPDFDHMTLLAQLEERWLVDVGFGDSFEEPLLLDKREPQVQGGHAFRIDATGDNRLTVMRRNSDGEWKAQYRFTLTPHVYADYEEMCRYHQTSPKSHFTRQRICSRATTDGRVTISQMRLIITTRGERVERELASEEEYDRALREYFDLVMPG